MNHLQTCGTKYRGCDPNCPKDLRERIEALRENPNGVNDATNIAVLEAKLAVAEVNGRTTRLTADKAAVLAAEARKSRTIEAAMASGWIDYIDGCIRKAAEKGGTVLQEPIKGVRMPCSDEQKAAIAKHYREAGFSVCEMHGQIIDIRWGVFA